MNDKYENENDSECSYPSDNMSLPSSSSSSEEEEEDNISKNIYFQPSQPMENRAVELYRSNLEELKTKSCTGMKLSSSASSFTTTDASSKCKSETISMFNIFLKWFYRLKEQNEKLEQFNSRKLLEEYFTEGKIIEKSKEILTAIVYKTIAISQHFQCMHVSLRHVIIAIDSIQHYEKSYLSKPNLNGLPKILKCGHTIDELGRENILGWLQKDALHPNANLPSDYSLQFIRNDDHFEEMISKDEGNRIFENWIEADEEIHKYRIRKLFSDISTKANGMKNLSNSSCSSSNNNSNNSNNSRKCEEELLVNDNYEGILINEKFDCVNLELFRNLIQSNTDVKFIPKYSDNAIYLVRRWYDMSMMDLLENYFKKILSSSLSTILCNEEEEDEVEKVNKNPTTDNTKTPLQDKAQSSSKLQKTPATLENEKLNMKQQKKYANRSINLTGNVHYNDDNDKSADYRSHNRNKRVKFS